jgi:hypothetical protein
MELTVIGILVGIALGLRYKALILVPAITLAAIFALIVGLARADSFWSIVWTIVTVVSTVQLGYLAGIGIHAIIEDFFPSRNGNGDSGQNLDSRSASGFIARYACPSVGMAILLVLPYLVGG